MLRFSDEMKKPIKGFAPQAVEALMTYGWPGNVRELENRVKRAVVMAEGSYVTPENLELQTTVSPVDASTLKSSRDHHEKELVRLAMEKAEGNVTRAASYLGVSRPTLYQLLARYGLKKKSAEDHT